jgi:rfaE bifunctional protein nucleotidyltransferase chain/domain
MEKLKTLEELSEIVINLNNEDKNVILCHGCFDVLHFGHLRHFVEAKKSADVLIVTITPDHFVNKGEDRPIFSQSLRAELLCGLSVIDYLGINNWASAVETIRLIKPNYFAKGNEYESPDQIVNPLFNMEKEVLEENGGKMIFTYEETSSSSEIIKKIKSL